MLFINWHSKGEYIAPAFQILFAGGAVQIVIWNQKIKRLKYALAIPVVVLGLFLAPLARPLLSVEDFLVYQSALVLQPPNNEGNQLAGLPQFYADMFGWEDLAKNVSKVYKSLPDEEKKHTVVYCSNYGKAGAIEYYSKKYDVPNVICPHNSYWYWSREILDKNLNTVIIVGGQREDHLKALEHVGQVAEVKCNYCMPYENNLPVYVGKKLIMDLQDIWEAKKSIN